MKKFKTLIPAFCAMLISAVMLGTSTYAWFSVNTKVTATDMQVTAQANTQYFVISQTQDFSRNVVTVAAQKESGGIEGAAKVYPAAYTTSTINSTNGDGTSTAENTWYTANTSVYNTAENTYISNIKTLTKGSNPDKSVYEKNTDYFVAYTFYVGLAANSGDYSGALKIKATNQSGEDDKGARVAAVKIDQYTKSESSWNADTLTETLLVAGSDEAKTSSTGNFALSAGATPKCVKVTVYVYIDGIHAKVKDENAPALNGSVSIQVGASDVTLA